MNTIRAFAGPVGAVFAAVAIARYIWAIIKTCKHAPHLQVRPQRVTWGVISVIGWTFLAFNVAMGASDTLWLPMVYALGPTIVALLSLRYGTGGAAKSDLAALTVAVLSLVLWWSAGLVVGFVAVLVADAAGIWPTILKTLRQPKSEDRIAWLVTTLGCLVNLVAVPDFFSGIGAYALYQVVANGAIAVLASRKRT